MSSFFNGALSLGAAVIALFFFRFYRQSGERLFGIFSWAFSMMAMERLLLELTDPDMESRPLIYLVRLSAFVLIILGIVDKNRKQGAREVEILKSPPRPRLRAIR